MRHSFSLRTQAAASCAVALAATAIGIRTVAASGAVGSSMGAASTTPLVTWTGWYDGHKVLFISTTKAVALTSDNQILSLQKAGALTLRFTGVVLNCPILKVLGRS